MSKVIPRDSLSNYERWEPPSMDDFSPAQERSPAASPAAAQDVGTVRSLPTVDEIEAIQREAQEEGFAAGYQDGRKEGREQGYKKGLQEGRGDGYQKGFEEGLSAGREETAARAEKLRQILDFMARPLIELDDVVEEELVYLATEIARQLVRRELKTSPGEIVAVVRKAVSLLPVTDRQIAIHLQPEDARLVREALTLGGEEQHWRIVEDPALTRGGCTLDSHMSRIDATLEKRLGAVIATVLGGEREQDHDRC